MTTTNLRSLKSQTRSTDCQPKKAHHLTIEDMFWSTDWNLKTKNANQTMTQETQYRKQVLMISSHTLAIGH